MNVKKKYFMLLNKEADRTLLHSLDECLVIDVRTIMIHSFTI